MLWLVKLRLMVLLHNPWAQVAPLCHLTTLFYGLLVQNLHDWTESTRMSLCSYCKLSTLKSLKKGFIRSSVLHHCYCICPFTAAGSLLNCSMSERKLGVQWVIGNSPCRVIYPELFLFMDLFAKSVDPVETSSSVALTLLRWFWYQVPDDTHCNCWNDSTEWAEHVKKNKKH